MGRRAGYLALNAGIAVGATSILLPEIDFDIQTDIMDRMRRTQKTGKKHFIIVVAEGATEKLVEQGISGISGLARFIEHNIGVESRATVLGHVQRGGSPSVKDRVIASRMGSYAAHLLLDGVGNRVVAMQKEEILDFDIVEALNMTKSLDKDIYRTAMEISI